MTRPGRLVWICVVGAVVGASPGRAQPGGQPDKGIELSPAVLRQIEAPYLTPDEARELRIVHGVWRAEDLDSPAARARAALQRGAWHDPSLTDPAAAVLDRVEGMLARGELVEALEALAGESGLRAMRQRASALAGLGRFDEADAALDPLVDLMMRQQLTDAAQLAQGVAGLMLREKIHGTRRSGGDDDRARAAVATDFRTMMGLLARARDELDRFDWSSRLVEARLLLAKHNPSQARQAALEALTLNPQLAPAWEVLGRQAVEAYDIPAALHIADRLDELAGSLAGSDGAVSLGAIIRARARLRQQDPQEAQRALAPFLAAYPAHREALAIQAAIAATGFDRARTDELLAHFDALSPGSPEALYAVGAALSEARQYELAADHLQRAHDRLASWPEPIIELGLLQMQSGRDRAARLALSEAVRLDPFNARADNSLRLITELLTYKTVQSEHFIVRYRDGLDGVLAPEMLPVLERIHATVAGAIDHEPQGRTVIELMPDHAWFSVRITGMTGIHTMAAATGPVIAMESPREGPGHMIGQYDWPRVLQHEYTHTVTLSRTHNRIPHWFTEAAAVYLEQSPRPYEWCVLLNNAWTSSELFDLETINLAFVRPKKPTDRALAYAQGHWMYEYIVQAFGERAPLELMDLYAQGVAEDEAIRRVLGMSAGEFLARFRVWAGAQIRQWGMRPPMGAPTLAALLSEAAQQPDAPSSPTRDMVEGWLGRYPDHPEILELAVDLALRRSDGRVTEASAALIERWAHAVPVSPTPRKLLASYYLASDEPTRAIETLGWLDAREQHTPAYAARLARLLGAQGRWEEAFAKAQRATRIAPFDADQRELAAAVAIKAGRLAAAQEHIEALVAIEPDVAQHNDRLAAIRAMRQRPGG